MPIKKSYISSFSKKPPILDEKMIIGASVQRSFGGCTRVMPVHFFPFLKWFVSEWSNVVRMYEKRSLKKLQNQKLWRPGESRAGTILPLVPPRHRCSPGCFLAVPVSPRLPGEKDRNWRKRDWSVFLEAKHGTQAFLLLRMQIFANQ